jgi:hypothetical protein
MKCVKEKLTGKISRVSNVAAFAMVNTGKYEYSPKEQWKSGGRP